MNNTDKTAVTAAISQKDREAYAKAKRQIAKSIEDNQHLIDIQTDSRTVASDLSVIVNKSGHKTSTSGKYNAEALRWIRDTEANKEKNLRLQRGYMKAQAM